MFIPTDMQVTKSSSLFCLNRKSKAQDWYLRRAKWANRNLIPSAWCCLLTPDHSSLGKETQECASFGPKDTAAHARFKPIWTEKTNYQSASCVVPVSSYIQTWDPPNCFTNTGVKCGPRLMQGTAIGSSSLCPSSMLAAKSHLEPSYYSVFSSCHRNEACLANGQISSSLAVLSISLSIHRHIAVQKHLYISASFFRSLKVLWEKLVHLIDSKRMVHSKFKKEECISLPPCLPGKELKTHLSLPLLRQFLGKLFWARLLLLGQ